MNIQEATSFVECERARFFPIRGLCWGQPSLSLAFEEAEQLGVRPTPVPHPSAQRMQLRRIADLCVRCVIAILVVLALAGCSDEVTTRFATLEDAKLQGAFERRWLPPVLPGSARSIIESNNLDINTGTGSFEYDLSERAAYVERLTGVGAALHAEKATDILILTTNGSRWEIRLPQGAGKAEWSLRQL